MLRTSNECFDRNKMLAKKQTTLSSLFKSPSTISSNASQQKTETNRKHPKTDYEATWERGVVANFPGSELIKGRTSKSSTVRKVCILVIVILSAIVTSAWLSTMIFNWQPNDMFFFSFIIQTQTVMYTQTQIRQTQTQTHAHTRCLSLFLTEWLSHYTHAVGLWKTTTLSVCVWNTIIVWNLNKSVNSTYFSLALAVYNLRGRK